MFDIGFWELITITLIVLIMVRPENLPKFAKDAGKFLARLRNFISNAKKELAKEFKIEVPLVVRLAGTKFEEGKKILDNSGLEIISASDLSDAAQKVVNSIK